MTDNKTEEALQKACEIIKNNAPSIAQDINSGNTSGYSIWIRFDKELAPTLQIEKDYKL